MDESSALKDLGEYKMTLLDKIIRSDKISDAMYKDKKSESLDKLVYKQIFPFLYVDETQTDVLTYLCIETSVPRIPTGTIKDVRLTVLVYGHRECMQYDGYPGTRIDALSDYMDRIIMGEDVRKEFGIGRPKLETVNPAFPQKKYYGREMIYTIPDFKVKHVTG